MVIIYVSSDSNDLARLGADGEWKVTREETMLKLQAEIVRARERLVSGLHPDPEAKAEAESAFDDALMIKRLFETTGRIFTRKGLELSVRKQEARDAAARRRSTR